MQTWLVVLLIALAAVYFWFNLWYVTAKMVPRVLSGPPVASPTVTRTIIVAAIFLAAPACLAAVLCELTARWLRRLFPSFFIHRPQARP